MKYRIRKVYKDTKLDITDFCGGLNLSSQADTLGDSFSFNFAKSNGPIEAGAIIFFEDLEDQDLIFQGIVLTVTRGEFTDQIKCLDYAHFLNKSEKTIQFNGLSASEAINELLKDTGIGLGQIDHMTTRITKIFKDQTISAIISDILKQVHDELDHSHKLAMKGSSLNILRVDDKSVNHLVQMAKNLKTFPVASALDRATSVTESIENLKNSVKVYDENDCLIAEVNDQDSIAIYGLLTDVISLDKKDASQARNIASNQLKNLNKILKSTSLKLKGHFGVKPGMLLDLDVKELGLLGKYKIKSVTHDITNVHMMTLAVEGL